MGNGGKQQTVQVNCRLRLGRQIVKGKPALADIRQVVDIIDDRQRARSKGVALFLEAQGLLAHLLQQSRQSPPGFLPGITQYLQLCGNSFYLGDGAGGIAVPGPGLQVNLDHDQGRYDGKNREKYGRGGADPALRANRFAQVGLGRAQLVANRIQLRLHILLQLRR